MPRDFGCLLALALATAPAVGAGAAQPSALPANQRATVTFTRDIAPLLHERCGICHHPGGPAPFGLLTFQDARQRARQIAAVTRDRVMPPWKSEPGYGEFVGHRPLSDAEIARIQQWVSDGTVEGDARDLPPPPTWTDGWQLGQPDLVATLPEPYVLAAEGTDVSRVFVFRLPVRTLRYVRGLEFRPGNARVVHHANIRIDRTTASRLLDDQDAAPGYEGLLSHSAVYPDGHFLGWTPGQSAPLLPKGLAWRLPPETDLVVEVHMTPSGKREVVEPSIGLYLTTEAPDRTPAMLRLGRQTIDIAAGDSNYAIEDSFVLPVDVVVQAVQPHAHYRARTVEARATLPDGNKMWLLYIRNWDFRWQHVYRYVTPPVLPKGTTLSVRYTYDNSAANPRNPQQPPRRVHWGQWTNDEMGDVWIQVLPRDDRDLRVLNAAFRPKAMAEEIAGYETMIAQDPTRPQLHDDVALLYLDLGRGREAATHLEISVKLKPDSAAAHFNLGTALTVAGRLDNAIGEYRLALGLQPDYGVAHNNLGSVLVRLGRPGEALDHFREALRLDPSNAQAHYNAGSVLRSRGELAEAADHFRRAAQLAPDWIPALASLAWLQATAPDAALRDATRAIALAERVADLTARRDASALDVLATAYAAASQFERAVDTEQTALTLNPDPALAAAIQHRLELYRRRQPYRSTTGPAS